MIGQRPSMEPSRPRLGTMRVQPFFMAAVAWALLLTGCDRDSTPQAPGPSVNSIPEQEPTVQTIQTELSYTLAKTLDSGLEELRGVAIDSRDHIYLAGKSGIKVMDLDGRLLREWSTPSPARCVAVSDAGVVYVGEQVRVRTYDLQGRPLASWGQEGKGRGQFQYLTAIALSETNVFVADPGNRCVHRFDNTGDFIDDIGGRNADANYPGLVCPNPFLDCAVDEKGRLHVTNPGMLRVETFRFDGVLLGFWGKAGRQPERFWGCCNPTTIALTRGGRTVTGEKLWPRVKVYDADGRMLAFIGPQAFTPRTAGLDLALDSRERIFVTDPGDGKVRVFLEGASSE